MRLLLSSTPVLWFLFLFNLVVAVAAAFLVNGAQGLLTSVGMGIVSVGAGAALLRRRFDRSTRLHPRSLHSTPDGLDAGNLH